MVPLAGKPQRVVLFGVVLGNRAAKTAPKERIARAGHWTSAKCSIPVCQNQGVLNTQATDYHCNESGFYVIACESE
ncbi:hypothetical protein L596_017916 [Steinernema carpocapsae]|uniref:Uncharacterized protein n=1 Tax=Steinernema carpocapsae TaxID=34508 RepID=A0A4U5N328_STECR|nr:hypothetical protein L596_017916 [Steinernema carpocapsae]